MAEIQGTVFRNPDTGELATWNGQQWVVTPPPESGPEEGPLGIVSPEFRQGVREKMGRRAGLERFLGQALPSTIGTVVGGGIGTLAGPAAPVAVPVGAAAGGVAGELIAQELGLAPKSTAATITAGAAPIAGAAAGVGMRMGGQVIRAGLRQIAPVKAAISRKELVGITGELESLGTNILARQTGKMKLEPSRLREVINRSTAVLEPSELKNTRAALDELTEEITRRGLSETPHGQQALGLLQATREGLFPGARAARPIQPSAPPQFPRPSVRERGELYSPVASASPPSSGAHLPPPAEVTFDRYLSLRSEVGQAVNALERQAGIRLGSSKKLFAGMAQDLDEVAKTATGAKLRTAHLSQRFIERAKLDFAVKDLEEVVSGATKSLKGSGEDIAVNAKGVLDNLTALTNPRHARYDKNFADALKNELPEIKKLFVKLNELGPLGPAGPGSIVIRGRFAAVGAVIGSGIGGTLAGTPGALAGAGVGAALGAKGPEAIVALLLSPRGRKALEFAAREGRGTIDPIKWASLGQILSQEAMFAGREVTNAVRQRLQGAREGTGIRRGQRQGSLRELLERSER